MNTLSLQRWEKCAEWPLASVAVAFLCVVSVQVLVNRTGSPHACSSGACGSCMSPL